jgi:hypothetical protein
MTLTPEQLEEAKQLLGIPEEAAPATADTAESFTTSDSTTATTDTPVDPVPAAGNSLSVYCPNCSHLLAKVSNDAN